MNVKLYKYESPNNFINKTLTNEMAFTGTLRSESSVLDPEIEIETSTNLSNYSYMWVEEFNRYYYITNITSVTNKLWRLNCHVDVLMTYKPQILAHDAIIGRQKNLFNLYLADGETFKVQQNSKVVQKTFPNGFTGFDYVLLLAGGDGNAPAI